MLLEFGPSLNFRLSFPCLLLFQVLIPQGLIPFCLEHSQLESLFIIILFEFENPFDGWHPIKVILQFKNAIKFQCLNLEVTKVISWKLSSSNTFIIIIMILMRIWVGDVNGINFKFLLVRPSAFGSFNLLKLHGEFSYLLSKIDNGLISPHFMSLLKRNASSMRRLSFICHCWKWSRVEGGLQGSGKGGTGYRRRATDEKKVRYGHVGGAWAEKRVALETPTWRVGDGEHAPHSRSLPRPPHYSPLRGKNSSPFHPQRGFDSRRRPIIFSYFCDT